jgi:hypothetical protein
MRRCPATAAQNTGVNLYIFPRQIYPDTIRRSTDGKGLHTATIHHRPAARELIIKLRKKPIRL